MNNLIEKIAERARQLSDMFMDDLRANYPATTDTREELIRYCKSRGYTRGQMVRRILLEEFEQGGRDDD